VKRRLTKHPRCWAFRILISLSSITFFRPLYRNLRRIFLVDKAINILLSFRIFLSKELITTSFRSPRMRRRLSAVNIDLPNLLDDGLLSSPFKNRANVSHHLPATTRRRVSYSSPYILILFSLLIIYLIIHRYRLSVSCPRAIK
jgi:hypothetical protein